MANKETEGRIFLKQTAAVLETSHPVLRDGQLFITKDGVAKIGDGATHWASLSPVIPNSMMKWHGQWVGGSAQNTVVYKPNMVVLYREVPYVCIKQHTVPPGPLQGGSDVINPTMPEYWTPLIPPQDKNIGKGAYWHTENSTVTELEGIEKLSEITLTAPNRPRYLIKVNLPGTYIVKIRFTTTLNSSFINHGFLQKLTLGITGSTAQPMLDQYIAVSDASGGFESFVFGMATFDTGGSFKLEPSVQISNIESGNPYEAYIQVVKIA